MLTESSLRGSRKEAITMQGPWRHTACLTCSVTACGGGKLTVRLTLQPGRSLAKAQQRANEHEKLLCTAKTAEDPEQALGGSKAKRSEEQLT